jgi:hypothetical protein
LGFIGFGLALLVVQSATAQKEQKFTAQLTPVAMDLGQRDVIAGQGAVTAVLKGSQISITGSFEGLHSPATVVRLHRGRLTGLRGEPVFDLSAKGDTSGSIAGTVALMPTQLESLRRGEFYIQLSSQGAPDGNLWGWLLRPDGTAK